MRVRDCQYDNQNYYQKKKLSVCTIGSYSTPIWQLAPILWDCVGFLTLAASRCFHATKLIVYSFQFKKKELIFIPFAIIWCRDIHSALFIRGELSDSVTVQAAGRCSVTCWFVRMDDGGEEI